MSGCYLEPQLPVEDVNKLFLYFWERVWTGLIFICLWKTEYNHMDICAEDNDFL